LKALRHRYEYRGSGFLQWEERCFDDAWEVKDGRPLPFAVRLPDDVAVEEDRDLARRQIAMEVEGSSELEGASSQI
jgi:hypothetical protein